MEIWGWIGNNWFDLLSTVGGIPGLWFAAISLHSDAKARRIANLLTLTSNSRELKQVFYEGQDLIRILDASADIKSKPITIAEAEYVNALIQHLSSVFQAMKIDLTIKPEGLQRDIREFFLLPIPKAVWQKAKQFQDVDFITFVETAFK